MRPLVAAFAFLTRIPVWTGPLRDEDLGRSAAFFPVVGLVLGLGLTGLAFLVGAHLPPLVVGGLLAASLAALTGGFHLDGVADLFDAAGGGRGDRARMLAIMRDSRIGAHGAVALVLILLVKTAALADLVSRRDLLPLLACPALGRWAVTPLLAFFPYARAEGVGRAFSGRVGRGQVAVASGIVILVVGVLGLRMALPAVGALASAVALGLWLRRLLGGLTGDVYGAAVEIAETTALVIAAAS